MVDEGHDGSDTIPPRTPVRNRSGSLPEDDGMGPMRKKILAVQSLEVPSEAKARLVHKLLTERYVHLQNYARTSVGTDSHHSEGLTSWEQEETLGTFDAFKFWQSTFGESSSPQKFVLTAEDVKPTYSSRRQSVEAGDFAGELDFIERSLGCVHYQRNVKLQCAVCSRWYTCRLCHDAVEDHILPRKETKHMLCMFCGCAQKAAEACVNCGELAAHYFCSICKLWDSDRPTYHCNDCGICRRGLGLGKDYFHCKTCGVCKSIAVETSHKCIERVTDCDCPICGEYMFTSTRKVIYIDSCGHSIHEDCYAQHMKTSYKCPICYKSAVNMEAHFRNLDMEIQQQPMPPQFQDTRAVILCNDCCAKTSVKYHWLGLKCAVCGSYNTAEMQIIGKAPNLETVTGETGPSRRSTLSWIDPQIRPRSSHEHGSMEIANPFVRTAREVPDRYARSVSPTMPMFAAEYTRSRGNTIGTEASDDGDLDFWGGDEPRSVTSHSAVASNKEESEEEDSESDPDDDENEDDEDDNDEDDPIVLFGHR